MICFFTLCQYNIRMLTVLKLVTELGHLNVIHTKYRQYHIPVLAAQRVIFRLRISIVLVFIIDNLIYDLTT